jgi:DNA-binding response OmpR family regulator
VSAATVRAPRVVVVRALQREGYDVRHVVDGPSALSAGSSGGVDLLVLDLGLPGMDGLEVCRRLRGKGIDLPVVVMTARTGEADLVIGLDAGADDYVGKPFRISELLARVRVQLRRTAPGDVIRSGPLAIDTVSRRVEVDDEEVSLTPKEYDLLLLLARRAGAVVTREQIMRDVWHTDWLGATKTLDMHVSTLRRKLGDLTDPPRLIVTVRGVGFRFEG